VAFQGLLKSLKMTQVLEILGKVFEFNVGGFGNWRGYSRAQAQ